MQPPAGAWLGWSVLCLALVAVSAALHGTDAGLPRLWLADPVAIGVLCLLPGAAWAPALVVFSLLILAGGALSGAGLDTSIGMPLRHAGTFLPVHLLPVMLAAWVCRRWPVGPTVLQQPRLLARGLLNGALLPALVGALLAASLAPAVEGRQSVDDGVRWFFASLIGSVAVWPLVWVLQFRGWSHVRQTLAQARTLAMLSLGVAGALLAALYLPKPFIVIAWMPLVMAICAHFAATAVASLVTALAYAALMARGGLGLAPQAHGLEEALFTVSMLATLLPALFVAAVVEGLAQVSVQLRASEWRLRHLYEKTPAMLASVDQRGNLLSVSDVWLQKMGYAAHQVLGHPEVQFMTQASAHRMQDVIRPRALRDGRFDDVDLQMLKANGSVMDVRMSAVWEYDAEGMPSRTLAVLHDVTESKALAVRSHYAEHDPLTGLPNRVLLKDRLERCCAHHRRHGGSFAVGFLDLDHFKRVNDRYGHDAGDRLLKTVASRLLGSLRATDTVCRLAGDEFVLLLTVLDQEHDLPAIADKVLHSVAQECLLGDGPGAPRTDVSCSLGLAVFPKDGQDAPTLLAHADQAMYQAKARGRNRHVLFSG